MTSIGLSLVDDARCSCRGGTLDKLLQPRILSVLLRGAVHGYSIIQTLKAGEQSNLVSDDTAVYRALRTLENRRMIQSQWTLDDTGPAKKTYLLTEKGKICLTNWVRTLRDYKQGFEVIIEESSRLLTTAQSGPNHPIQSTETVHEH